MTGYQKINDKIKALELQAAKEAGEYARVDLLNALARELFVYDVDRSLQYLRDARTQATAIQYGRGVAASLNNESLCCRIKSDLKRSKQVAQEALRIYETLDDKAGQADALNNISFIEVNTEDYENALEHCLKALALANEAGNKEIEAFASLVNGMVSELLGDYPAAIEYHLRALALSREILDIANEGVALINLGIVFRKIGEPQKAKEHFEEAYRIFQDLHIKLLEASALYNLGMVYSEFADYDQALSYLRESLQIQRSINHVQGQGACHINIGIILTKQRQFDAAEENIRQSIEQARTFGRKNQECKGMMYLAELFLEQRDNREAILLLEEAHNEAELYGIKEVRFQILRVLSRAYEVSGDYKRAFSFYKEAMGMRDELINEESTRKNKGLMMIHEVETARRDREIAVRDKERAEQSDKFKEQFLANMSHEIRTPMNAIVGLVELLTKTPLNEQQKKYTGILQQASENLLSIIREILDFAKIEAGQIAFESNNFSVKQCIGEVVDTLAHQAVEKGISLQHVCDASVPPLLLGDALRLRQILLNLLSNAIKFTEKGSVRLTADAVQSADGSLVTIRVYDTGIGIAAEKLSDIFKNFVQGGAGTEHKYGGTGLGLSISKHLIELQGGTITVESTLGAGTVFTFSIPYQQARKELPEKQKEQAATDYRALEGLRILLAEDNQFNQMVAVDALQSLVPTMQIEIAENGKVALEKIHESDFDLVLLDLQMPEMDGYETARQIRMDGEPRLRDLPLIALTANATQSEKEKCLAKGMNAYVSKPFKAAELIRQIQQVIAVTSG